MADRGAEVDFIIQFDGFIIAIEVKSADNTKAKSLNVYIQANKPNYAIKLSAKNFGFEDGKKQFLFMLLSVFNKSGKKTCHYIERQVFWYLNHNFIFISDFHSMHVKPAAVSCKKPCSYGTDVIKNKR